MTFGPPRRADVYNRGRHVWTKQRAKIINALTELKIATIGEVAEATGLEQTTVGRNLHILVNTGQVRIAGIRAKGRGRAYQWEWIG